MSKQAIQSLRQNLHEQIKNLPPKTKGQRCIVGLSGGIDSVVLLHAVINSGSLNPDLIYAVHINHGIHPESLQWARFCEEYSHQLGVEFKAFKLELLNSKDNLEQAARNARYHCFAQVMNKNAVLLTAHQQSDQAETVLFNLFRGSGVVGLKAMRTFKKFTHGFHLRPLLNVTKAQISAYATQHNLSWVEDSSNQDISFDRNYIRQQVLPIIKQRWPQALSSIQTSAAHLSEAQTLLDQLAIEDLESIQAIQHPGVIEDMYLSVLVLAKLQLLSTQRQSNVLRYWVKLHTALSIANKPFGQLIEHLSNSDVGTVFLIESAGFQIRCYQGYLYLLRKMPEIPAAQLRCLRLNQQYDFPDLGVSIHFRPDIIKHSDFYFKRRIGGENIFYKGKNRRVKQLLQENRIPTWERERLPMLYLSNTVAAIAGLLASDDLYSRFDKTAQVFKVTRFSNLD